MWARKSAWATVGSMDLPALIRDFGAFSVIIFMLYRMSTVTIPKMVDQFKEITDQQRADYKAIATQQMEFFHREMEREREIHGAHVERIIETLKNLEAA